MPRPESWLKVAPGGLYCEPGDFYIDPQARVDRAVVTHGHGDHARPGHGVVLATPETVAVMQARLGDRAGRSFRPLRYGETIRLGDVSVRLAPAGHILGSAQVVLEHAGTRIVVSGDYKWRPDATCAAFELVPCDVFITEATFGLPVYRHPDDREEIGKLLASLRRNPDRTHYVAAYALGKTQRVIALLRAAGYDRPIYLHDSLLGLCRLYEAFGIGLGDLRPVVPDEARHLAGEVVLGPPGGGRNGWGAGLPDPITAFASGWMRLRQRARASGAELPLILSDHADWDELTRTIEAVGAAEVWITHGREDALVHHAGRRGIRARALSMVGFDEDDA